jgi:hypothetical protein
MKRHDLDLTFPAMEGTARKRPERGHRPIREPQKPRTIGIVALVVAVLLIGIGIGHAVGADNSADIAAQALVEAQEAQNVAGVWKDDAARWQAAAVVASETAQAMESDLASATAAAELWQKRAEDASITIDALEEDVESLTSKIRQQGYTKPATPSAPATGTITASASNGRAWSAAQVTAALKQAAAYYGLTAAQTEWVAATGARIAYRESTYRPYAVNSSNHAGLFQFSGAWGSGACSHGANDWRVCGICSCYRFVRVYKEGGEAAVARHWAATI